MLAAGARHRASRPEAPAPAGPIAAPSDAEAAPLSRTGAEQVRFDRLVGWSSIPLNAWYIAKLAPHMSAAHVAQMVWFNTPVVLFCVVSAGLRPRSYLRHRTLLQALARINGFVVPVVATREAFDATIRAPVDVPLLGGAFTALVLSLASRTWLLLHVALAHRIPLGPHLVTQTVCWAALCLRARRNFCQTEILSSAPLLAAAGRLHGLMGTVATAIAPMTSLVLPRTDPASCEAALLFVWTLGLLVPSVWLASGGATPESRQRPVLALVDGWLSHLRFPGRPSLHATTTWCLHWALALVCVWVACCVAVGGGAP